MSPVPDPQSRPVVPPTREDLERSPQPIRIVLEQGSNVSRWGNRLAWVGLVICILVIMYMAGAYRDYFQTNPQINEKYHSLSKIATDKIAIITIDGTIMHTDGFAKWQIDQVREDENIKAVVLRVDSPGGTVTGSDYLYHQLLKLKKEKGIPLVVSMGGIAASGGYYVSMAVENTENSIYAENTTWTGSIGVMIPHYDVSGLMADWKIEDDTLVSHPLKAMGSFTKDMTAEERKILQALVNESFEDFKAIVQSGRPRMNAAKLDEVATGQIFTAKQAKKHGLVDRIGFLDDAIDRAIELASLERLDVRVVKYTRPKGLLDDVIGLEASAPKFDLSSMLDLSAPRAYYLCSWLPAIAKNAVRH